MSHFLLYHAFHVPQFILSLRKWPAWRMGEKNYKEEENIVKLGTVQKNGRETACMVFEQGLLLLRDLNENLGKNFAEDVLAIIKNEEMDNLNDCYQSLRKKGLGTLEQKILEHGSLQFGPLYRNPGKIWGIGLNYQAHAADLAEVSPSEEPASFMKPNTTIIGPGAEIVLPLQSHKTTGEAELGVILGKKCKDVERKDWLSVVAGFTTIIDMTAEDILRRNPRFLTRAKSFDTFFSFGPLLVTPDELKDVLQLKVATVLNDRIHGENVVSNMTFTPDYLVSFHSKVMTMEPGDIISTGTPGAVPLKQGDLVECRITGFETLRNPVIDQKLHKEK